MKLLFFLPLLFTLALASEETVKIDQEIVINALKKLEGTKITLPKELADELQLAAEDGGSGITAIVDDYVDTLMVYVRNYIVKAGLDPTEMDDTELKLVPTGTITLSSGWLQDLSTIERNGNTTVGYSSSSKVISLYLPIKFNAMLVTYKYVTKVLLLTIKGDVNGKIEDLNINIKLSYDYNTYQASLETFDITDSGRLSLKFTGNDLVDWITNTMTTVTAAFLQPVIIRVIQSIIMGGLETVVDEVNELISSIFNP